MKKLIIILWLLPIISKAQNYSGSWPDIKFTSSTLCSKRCSIMRMMVDSLNTLYVSDSCVGEAAYYNKRELVVYDSLATIKVLFYFMNRNIKEHEEMCQKYYAAQNILSYVTVDGGISDKSKFDKAVKEYNKVIKKYNPTIKYQRITTTTKKK